MIFLALGRKMFFTFKLKYCIKILLEYLKQNENFPFHYVALLFYEGLQVHRQYQI